MLTDEYKLVRRTKEKLKEEKKELFFLEKKKKKLGRDTLSKNRCRLNRTKQKEMPLFLYIYMDAQLD
jgi:hypothetical protein